jgi:hypothetical protein
MMSPSDLEVLIHYHVSPEPHSRRNAPAVRDAIDRFFGDGILESLPDDAKQYTTTARGRKFLEMILSTPYPKLVWIDPRKEEQ